MANRGKNWGRVPPTSQAPGSLEYTNATGPSSDAGDYEWNEDTFLALQEDEFDNSNRPYIVNPANAVCVGTWKNLPLEIKTEILSHLLPFRHPICSEDMEDGLDRVLQHYSRVSKVFRDDINQFFYQQNTICLRPGLYTGFGGEDKLSLTYPPRHVNHYIKRLDYFVYDECDGSRFIVKDTVEGGKKTMNDTWHYLRNIALGAYGFLTLEHIRVFFEAQPEYMQVFWAWKIKVKVRNEYHVILPDEEQWEEELQTLLAFRPPTDIFQPYRELVEPGFELIKRNNIP